MKNHEYRYLGLVLVLYIIKVHYLIKTILFGDGMILFYCPTRSAIYHATRQFTCSYRSKLVGVLISQILCWSKRFIKVELFILSGPKAYSVGLVPIAISLHRCW